MNRRGLQSYVVTETSPNQASEIGNALCLSIRRNSLFFLQIIQLMVES